LLVVFIARANLGFVMQKNESYAKSAKEIVNGFVEALERNDFKTVRSHISDNVSVLAPGPVELTRFNQAEPYVTYLEHSYPTHIFSIKRAPFSIAEHCSRIHASVPLLVLEEMS
jgi:hypothetical protein